MKHKFHIPEQTIWNECQIKEKELHVAYLLTYLLNGAESFLRSKQFTVSQEIPCILWNPTVHYHIHKCLSPVPHPEPAQSSPYPHNLIPKDPS